MRTGAETAAWLQSEIELSKAKMNAYAVPSWERTHNENRTRFFLEVLRYVEERSDYESAGSKGK